MKRTLLVAFVVALLVAQPATADPYPSAEAACGQAGDGEVLVGIFPGATELNDDGSQVVTGEVAVYAGTTFRVALCSGGELKHTRGSEWSLESQSGLEVTDRTDATVTVRVTGETGEIDVPALVAGKQNLRGVSVVVRDTARADSALVDDPITVQNASAVATYNATEQAYRSALSNLSTATKRLNASAMALKSGEANASVVDGDVLSALNQSRQEVTDHGRRLERRLYATAWQSGGDSNALDALTVAQKRERTAKQDAKQAMRNYLAALKTAEQNARSTVFVNLGGSALLGLVVGAIPGWWLTERKLESIRFDRQVNADVSYGPRLLAQAVGLAVLALAVTLGVLVALGGLGKLGGLL